MDCQIHFPRTTKTPSPPAKGLKWLQLAAKSLNLFLVFSRFFRLIHAAELLGFVRTRIKPVYCKSDVSEKVSLFLIRYRYNDLRLFQQQRLHDQSPAIALKPVLRTNRQMKNIHLS